MRLRNNPNARALINEHPEIVLAITTKTDLASVFNNDHPVHIEIGMGKGDFIIELAKRHPDINYIGIEKFDSVMYVALKKLLENGCPENLRLLCVDAVKLPELFEGKSIQQIYLNFSDPWPKSKHAKRRLTYKTYLDIYVHLLQTNGHLEFKTDNRGLFEYSIVSMNNYGMIFKDICLDLHHSDGYEDNVMTEYERKFSPFGPIYKIVAQFK